MVRWGIPIVIGAVLGLVSGITGIDPVPLPVLVALVAFWLLYCKIWVRRTYARRYLAYARKHLDPQAGPPADSEPVELPIAHRLDAVQDGDFDAIRAFYTDDCLFSVAGRKKPFSLERYMRLERATHGWLDGDAAIAQTLSDLGEPDAFWLQIGASYRPKRGEPFEVKWLEAWTLTPEHDRIRSRNIVAFTDVAVATRSA